MSENDDITVTFCGAASGETELKRGSTMRDAAQKLNIDITHLQWHDLHSGGEVGRLGADRPLESSTCYTMLRHYEDDETIVEKNTSAEEKK